MCRNASLYVVVYCVLNSNLCISVCLGAVWISIQSGTAASEGAGWIS